MKSRICSSTGKRMFAETADKFKSDLIHEMKKRDINRSEFSKSMGWSPSATSHFLNNSGDITLGTAYLCCAALGMRLAIRMEGRDNG